MAEEFTASEKKALLASLSRIEGALERQEDLIKELRLWARLGVTERAKRFFEGTLKTDKEKWVYEALDGEATQAMIHDRTSVPQQTISRWGKEWEALGIVVDVAEGNRRKLVPLSALGIEVPPVPESSS